MESEDMEPVQAAGIQRDIAQLQSDVSKVQADTGKMQTDNAKIETNVGWIRQKVEETYIELRMMKDVYVRKEQFAEVVTDLRKLCELMASKEELNNIAREKEDLKKEVESIKKTINGVIATLILALAGLVWKVFLINIHLGG